MSGAFERLKAFLVGQMRMSHIYQPVMIKCMLDHNGSANRQTIARSILEHDPSQVEYYEQIVTKMVGRVLTSKPDLVQRDGREYQLVGAANFSEAERADLVAICDQQINRFLNQRGRAVWHHRRRQGRVMSGSVRYEVLKRAHFRCELCGISAAEKAIEVDHIRPRNCGGSDEITNLQALCYTCNASKRDRDDTDFRAWEGLFDHRQPGCLFCEVPAESVIAENALAYVHRDGFPVTHLHTLIIPKRHVASYFELTQPELNAIHQLVIAQKSEIEASDRGIAGFNVGVNGGEAAGQTIMHAHIHLIPRRPDDVEQPRGGIRNVIPGRGDY